MRNFFKQKNKNQKVPNLPRGFTLIETLVAVSIFSVSILGLLIILSQGIADTNYAKKKIIAAYLTQEGIEYARNVRDTYVLYTETTGKNWSNFRDANIADITPSSPADSSFSRTIQKTIVNSEEVKIFSTVSWTQGSGNYSITFSENLFNWTQ
ncbi:MAG: hypothetical protein UU82_C0003G0005 [Candidatus Nomurabacteria bacterium GW2011_GWC2_41_8]|uniref:Type IV pilus modification protein PilV n=3 Tax=Candidatus Nomuraibacteriota TaxID=1752729 RepID=A0A1F6YDD9_9BACT|nr:MAG: hypothetical protein UU58_C0001G0062 [Candidatus Nomurabacteria bacterium GW2011_GWA2_41_25]KKS24573.1 MAG: hypothetical protein UU82_C0003G0005 [Candidatus Nomurabacteria bacterium GW2011_GWC2_41_8]OGI66992.1 MAG: hypothetical protein A2823_02755 [Candidatus Nomurabacteria bacterium RIFCSPHIGHO2_01_FULL_41_91]OGI80471.1 MAG: hypothetical protein A3D43_00370 [Candidatus Nomurabacteria bacterium RIFCSPHIGHO2_02_FULL_41_52]OGI85137.1 MAG: hypothetical protein A3F49_01775 [Candidatus Nomur